MVNLRTTFLDWLPLCHDFAFCREFTGVGSYTNFQSDAVIAAADKPISLKETIVIPGLERGLQAILFFENHTLKSLELVSSDEYWDGVYEGFSIPSSL